MDPNGITDIGASFGDDLPVPDFSRLGRWAASRLTDAGGLAGGVYGWIYDKPAPEPDSDMLVRTTASFPTNLEREKTQKLDDDINNAQDMALGGSVTGGGRTKKKKRSKKKRSKKKRSKKKRSKKKRSKKR